MEWTLTIDSGSSSSTPSVQIEESLESVAKHDITPQTDEEEVTSVSDESKASITAEFDSSFTPFNVRWIFGRNIHVPFINLTSQNHKKVMYAAAHFGVIFDYNRNEMSYLQGHQNIITSVASDRYGKWVVTADAGKDSVIIVWDSENCLPVCTIFEPHGYYGTRIIGMSPDATYLVSISDGKEQQIACWKWTLGEKMPHGTYIVPPQCGRVVHIAFCKQNVEYFVITTENCVLFGLWEKDTLTIIPKEKAKKRVGKLTCSVYQHYSHYVLTTTEHGNLLMWSDVPFSMAYNFTSPISNDKQLLRTLKLDNGAIKVVKSYKEIIVTGNSLGEVCFYDKMIKILYWVQPFRLNSITYIDFHLWYQDMADVQLLDSVSSDESDNYEKFNPFATLEKAFDRIIIKEKSKLAELDLLPPIPVPKHLIDDICKIVHKKVAKWNVNDFYDKKRYIEKIVKVALNVLESKYSAAINTTEKLIVNFANCVLDELERQEALHQEATSVSQGIVGDLMNRIEKEAEQSKNAKDAVKNVMQNILDTIEDETKEDTSKSVAHDIISQMFGHLDETSEQPGNQSSPRTSVAHDIITDMLQNVGARENAKRGVKDLLKEIFDTLSVDYDFDDANSVVEYIVKCLYEQIREKIALDPENIVHIVVNCLLKKIQVKSKSGDEKNACFQIFNTLQNVINRAATTGKHEERPPTDATLERDPFIVGDFMISTVDGDIGLIQFLKNSYIPLVDKFKNPVTALDCHLEKPQFVVGNSAGYVILYDYLQARGSILQNQLDPEQSVTALKFAPSGFFLACGLSDGSFWILNSSILTTVLTTPQIHVNAPITQICFSDDSQWIAHKDDGMRLCLYHCEDPSGSDLEFMGKQKAHFKPISDIMFTRSLEKELHLFSLGEDRMLVEYDLMQSEPDDLKILLIERIEQSAIPLCMAEYPKFGAECFILVANSEYKFKIFNDTSRMCRKTCLGPRFEKPVSKFSILPPLAEKSTQYMIYACEKHIGIQMLPLDGNPYKAVGMVGHPTKVKFMKVCGCHRILFSVGEDDTAIFMWTINTRSVDVMSHIGGEGLNPYFCLIEGGQNGWLFKEIQDFFYYAQILHEGENTTSVRNVSSEIPLCEVPDLMRAIGFFPSEHEIGNMLHEVQFWSYSDNGKHMKTIGFEDFVKLYVNHQPAFGTSYTKLREAFETFADEITSDGPMMWRETLTSMLQERAECLSREQVVKYLQVLIPTTNRPGSISSSQSSSSSNESLWDFIPEEITYKTFLEDILGIAPAEKAKDEMALKQERKKPFDIEEDEEEEEVEEEEQIDENDSCADSLLE